MMDGDRSTDARLAATFAVGQIDAPQSHVLAAAVSVPETSRQAAEYVIEIGAQAVAGVQAALGVTTDSRARADLVHLLGYVGTRDTVAVLEPLRQDKDERVSRAAADAIARIGRS